METGVSHTLTPHSKQQALLCASYLIQSSPQAYAVLLRLTSCLPVGLQGCFCPSLGLCPQAQSQEGPRLCRG